MRWFVEMHVKSLLGVKSIQSSIGMLNGSNASAIDTILQMKNLTCDWKSKYQSFSGRRRPRRPGSIKPSFPSLKSSRTSQFSSMTFVIGGQTSRIQNWSLKTETRNLKFQDWFYATYKKSRNFNLVKHVVTNYDLIDKPRFPAKRKKLCQWKCEKFTPGIG